MTSTLPSEYTDCISVERKDSSSECPFYDINKSDGEAPGMRCTPSLTSFQGSLWLEVVAPDRGLSMAKLELFGI